MADGAAAQARVTQSGQLVDDAAQLRAVGEGGRDLIGQLEVRRDAETQAAIRVGDAHGAEGKPAAVQRSDAPLDAHAVSRVQALLGILVVEYRRRKDLWGATKVSGGWLLGCLIGRGLQLALGLVMIALFAWQAGWRGVR